MFCVPKILTTGGVNTVTKRNLTILIIAAIVVIAVTALALTHYEVNVEIEGEGTVEPMNVSVNILGTAEFKITPADGWRVSSVLLDGNPVEINDGILKLSNLSGNHKVRVIFTPLGTYQLETSSEGHGSVYTAAKSYMEGDDAVVEITPDEGYVISDVTVDGKSVGSINHLDITMDSGHSVNVKFREATDEDPTVDVSVDVKVGTSTGAFYGTITPSGSVRVAYGGTLIVSISLNEGYQLKSVIVDGKDVGTSSVVTVKDIVKDIDIDVTVVSEKLRTFTITSSSSAGGSISPSGTVTADEGDSVTFTITPNSGYRLSSLIIDGSSVSYSGRTYTFSKVSENHTISAVFAVKPTPTPPTPTKTLDSISLSGTPTEVTVNQTVSTTGMVVTAHWSDGSESQVTGYTISPTSFPTAGSNTVTVMYEGKTATFNINVKEQEFAVTFKADTGGSVSPTSVTVVKGTVPKISGDSLKFGSVTVTPSPISKNYLFGSWSRSDGSAVDAQITGNVTFTTSFLTLSKIEVVTQPTKTEYVDEESFESAGMKIQAVYGTDSRAKTADVLLSDCTFSPSRPLTPDDKSVTVSFIGKNASISVTVNQRYYTVSFTASDGGSVSSSTASIVKGTVPTVSDNILTFGTTTTVTPTADSGYIFDKWTRSSGNLTDAITSDVTFTASFLKLESISVKTQPSKTSYIVGENFNPAGMAIQAVYGTGSDAKTVDVTAGYTYAPEGALALTDKKITVTYLEKTAEVAITVAKAQYTVTFAASDGGIVSQESLTVTDGDKLTVSGDNLTYNSTTITPTATEGYVFGYWSRSDNLDVDAEIKSNVTITAKFLPLTGITMKTSPTKMSYYVGETFNEAGTAIQAVYSDGTQTKNADVALSECIFTPETFTEAGQKVTVTYKEKTAEISVTVPTLSGIDITTEPSVTIFARGATVDLTGMVVTARYTETGYDRTVTAYTASPKSFTEIGDKAITVTYSEGSITKTVTQPVKIVDTGVFSVKVTSYSGTKTVNGSVVSFSETPDKNLEYFTFDLSGISPGVTQTVTLKITNDTTADLKACVFVSSMKAGSSTELAKQIYISSGETKKSVSEAADKSFLDLGTMNKGGTQEITLTISFPHSENNNEVMGKNITFSLGVFANYP